MTDWEKKVTLTLNYEIIAVNGGSYASVETELYLRCLYRCGAHFWGTIIGTLYGSM